LPDGTGRLPVKCPTPADYVILPRTPRIGKTLYRHAWHSDRKLAVHRTSRLSRSSWRKASAAGVASRQPKTAKIFLAHAPRRSYKEVLGSAASR
jgi:hypothetical protein